MAVDAADPTPDAVQAEAVPAELDRPEADSLLDRLAAQIDAMIEEEGYVSNESVRDRIYLSWAERDGELFATSEYIVYYANPPKNTDPDEFVSDHEHLFASIKLK